MKRTTTRGKEIRLAALCLVVLLPAALAAQDQQPTYQVGRYEIDLELAPETHQLRARARLEAVANEPLSAILLHQNRNLKVEKVLGAEGQPLNFEQLPRAATFRVNLPQPVAQRQTFTLTVEYLGAFDPALAAEEGPVLAFIAPEKSYLLPASRWFPQAENLWDRFAMTLRVTLPEGEMALATGSAEPAQPAGAGKTKTVFRVEEPTLAGTLVTGVFQKLEPTAGVPLTFYLRTVPESYASANAEKLADIITFFSDKFGPLKDPRLAVVETPDDTWEAHAAPGLLLLPVRQWANDIDSRLLARTLARQWWADRVSPADASDAWLADGLARYSEVLYIEHSAGEEGMRRALEDLTIEALIDESAAAIGNADQLAPQSPAYASIVRDKGAMVFHMLRQVLGEEIFFRLLRDYADRFQGRPATIDAFERLTEEISGQQLDYFFAEWIRSTGVPQFNLEYVIYRTQEGFRVGGELKQQLEIFRMPVPIRVETEGPPVTQTVDVAGTSTDFSIDTFGKPTNIEIDPNFTVLKFTPDLRLRVAIARGEANFRRGKTFEAIQSYQQALEVKRNSSLAHYRIGEAFFQQRNYQAAANAFREALNGDRKPQWTVVWSYIFLGKIFDITGQRERAVNEYRKALETNDNTAGAQEEARRYLREPYRRKARTIEQIERR